MNDLLHTNMHTSINLTTKFAQFKTVKHHSDKIDKTFFHLFYDHLPL